jgi:hypothetical protein
VHAAGVWEDTKDAYLNELLVRKTGHASVVAVLMNAVFRALFQAQTIDFLVTINCGCGRSTILCWYNIFSLQHQNVSVVIAHVWFPRLMMTRQL